MPFHAYNGAVSVADTAMEYIRFGSGPETLIMLPGLGDGLRTMKGTALPMALMYRRFARDFTVYAFSRRDRIPAGATTRDMAEDVAAAMELLQIPRAHILGVSMGGMIAQHLAADHPEKVRKLILTVTCPQANPIAEAAIHQWLECADRGDHTGLMDSNLQLIYSPGYYRKNKWMIPLVGRLTKPKSYDRFRKQAQACLAHCALDTLSGISCPTLVIGGEQDLVLGADASRELAAAIPGARLRMYPQWGHGLYEEAGDFQDAAFSFLKEG